jgi:hypothetical protein
VAQRLAPARESSRQVVRTRCTGPPDDERLDFRAITKADLGFALAAYVTFESLRALSGRHDADSSRSALA